MAEISAALVKQLRDKTGAGMMDAKKALVENNGDLEASADWLREKGILYAPDYVINAGGILNVSFELLPGGYDEERAVAKIDRIYDNLRQVFAIAREQKVSTHVAADRLAEQRIAAGRKTPVKA